MRSIGGFKKKLKYIIIIIYSITISIKVINMGIVLILMIEIITFVILIVPGLALAGIITYLTKWKKLSGKNKFLQMLIYLVIVVVCACVLTYISFSILSYLSAMPDKTYVKMQEIHEEQSFIGLQKEEVTSLLGEPKYKFNDKDDNYYIYNAGTVTNMLVFGETNIYELTVYFDENDKVERTTLKYIV